MSHAAPLSPTWQAASDVLVSNREATHDESATIVHIRELAMAYANDELDLNEIRRLSSGRERWTATRFTSPAHQTFAPLMTMLDDLIATDPTDPNGWLYQTPFGVFTRRDLEDAGAEITKQPGNRLRIRFPIRWPWRRKPNADQGDQGERDDPYYARDAEERREIANRRTPTGPVRTSRTFE